MICVEMCVWDSVAQKPATSTSEVIATLSNFESFMYNEENTEKLHFSLSSVHCVISTGSILLGKEQQTRCSLAVMAVPVHVLYLSLILERDIDDCRKKARWMYSIETKTLNRKWRNRTLLQYFPLQLSQWLTAWKYSGLVFWEPSSSSVCPLWVTLFVALKIYCLLVQRLWCTTSKKETSTANCCD